MEMTPKKIRIVQTARDTGEYWAEKENIIFEPDLKGQENSVINIYEDIVYQEIEGFGGAFTEAAAVTLDKLKAEKRAEVLNAYFNPETGLGYTLCRTHINSCDFSLGNYAYVEIPGDINLASFSIHRDQQSLIPFIKDALTVKGANFRLLASPWSPPDWMKSNGEMNHGGKLKDEYKEVWARYFVKYIKAYAGVGIKIWGITVQNEPKATQKWDSCVFTPEEERDFIKNYLGPVLANEGFPEVKIIIWDHNKERVYDRAKIIFADSAAARYIWGVGFHWYSGDHFENLEITHQKFPDKKLVMTEGCLEYGVKLASWETGERYGHDIIGDLNNWTVAWVDWNMLLDENGGPNHAANYCDAPIIADTKTGELIYESSYYYLGHFSKFIKPGSKRIGYSKFTDNLEITAFKDPEEKIVVVVLNRSDRNIPFYLRNKDGIAKLESQSHSIMTLIYES